MTSTNGQGHTRGPWRYESGVFNQEVSQTAASGSIMSEDDWYIATIERVGGDEIANARLIAAAPDLLEACKGLLAKYDFGDDLPEDHPIVAARAALSRVSGEGQ